MKRILILTPALAVAIFCACSSGGEEPAGPLPGDQPPGQQTPQPDGGAALPPDHPPVTGEDPPAPPTGKATRRMSVDQLRRSLPILFDGREWILEDKKNRINLLDGTLQAIEKYDQNGGKLIPGLAGTLGEADYLLTSQSNLDPNTLFSRYMDDMALSMCGAALVEDGKNSVSAPEKRIILRYPVDVDRNLRYLRLKFHGVYVPENTTDGIRELRQLYDNTLKQPNGNPGAAWLAVCVALVSSPEMMTY
ncbi:MAG: hypothetical protein GMKNLPBB_02206 [Myxococcota bacterium]|nr:hypothetical protein [Myxococcota bacterium]